MKKRKKGLGATGAALLLFIAISAVMAAKPQSVIEISNGYPSGAHFNLNIHGKDPSKFSPDLTATGGKSVYIDLHGDSTLTIRSD